MLERNLNFVLRDGEYTIDTTTTYSWVGGAPVGLNTSGYITADYFTTGAVQYIGVAWHSQAESLLKEDLVSVIYGPARITIKQGSTSWPDGASVADAYTPWDGSVTYNIGDLLRPTLKNVGGVNYSVWTNAVLTNIGAYFAKVVEVEGSGSAPTSLTLVLGTFPVVTA